MKLFATFHSREELISEEAMSDLLRQAAVDEIFTLKTSDDESLVQFIAIGYDTFFVEQYISSAIYGGFYSMPIVVTILHKIFSPITSEELRHLFPTLEGDLVYTETEEKTG